MTTTDQRGASVERLLDDAWAVDCAIRLHEPDWAAAAVAHLAEELARHEQESLNAWHGVDPSTGEALATEVRALRDALPALADELRRGTSWPRPDFYQRVTTWIHHEAVAVADTAWPLDD